MRENSYLVWLNSMPNNDDCDTRWTWVEFEGDETEPAALTCFDTVAEILQGAGNYCVDHEPATIIPAGVREERYRGWYLYTNARSMHLWEVNIYRTQREVN